EIDVPPLRERVSDIPLLVEHFRRKVANELHRESIAGPSAAVLESFGSNEWRGNVRELEQVIRRTVIDSGGLVDAAAAARVMRDLSPSIATETPQPAAKEEEKADELIPLDEAEKRHIIAVLRATGGNQTQAAFILGIERKTLARKMKRFEIAVDDTTGAP
ncbi:MAG TPA: helix-turn-helix domain-containing protein, partial [Thermoanaerobaculia bacterium]|nr:helix-turn-helix domain-containing protein [Thermoanaerobaculia bacterium]